MHGSWKLTSPDQVDSRPPVLDQSSQALTPRRAWAIFLRRWRVILSTAAIVAGIAVIWVLQIQPIYSATTQILIDPRKEKVLGRSEAVVGDLGLDASAIATEVTLIKSFAIARRVVERLRLDQHPRFGKRKPGVGVFGYVTGAVRGLFGAHQEVEPPIEQPKSALSDFDGLSPPALAAIASVQSAITVNRVAATYFLEISFDSPDPQVAAQLANAIAEAYLVEQLEARYQAANRAAMWLNERVGAVRQQLEASERALAEHRAQYNIVGAQAGTIADQQAAAINAQLVAARAETVQKKARYEQATKIMEGGAGIENVAAIMDSPVIAGLRAQDAAIARTEADLLTRYGPEHPQIVKTRAERADVRRQIRAEVGRVVQTLKTDYDFALQKEKSLEQSIEELTGADQRNDSAVIKLRELERQAQSNRLVYDTLLTRFKEAEQQTSLQTAESRVIAPALKPGTPRYPPTQRFLILALLGGLGLGIGVAFLLEYLENGFTTIEQVEAALKIPVLSMVPMISDRERAIDGKMVTIPDYVGLKPISRFGEAIRSVRVSMQMSNIDVPPKMFMVTSSIPSEGKTTLTLSLAVSAAVSGQRVLLLDGDLRHPSSSKYFNMHEGMGLTDLLTGKAQPENVFVRTPHAGLTFLPAGTTTRHPPDVLGSERFKSLMIALRKNYDIVMIDAPPLTPVIDSAILANVVDKVIFVVKWRTTPVGVVERALQILDNPRDKLAGIILNHTQLDIAATYAPYYSYYHKSYQKYYQQ